MKDYIYYLCSRPLRTVEVWRAFHIAGKISNKRSGSSLKTMNGCWAISHQILLDCVEKLMHHSCICSTNGSRHLSLVQYCRVWWQHVKLDAILHPSAMQLSVMVRCGPHSGRPLLFLCPCRGGSGLNPAYVRRWPLNGTMSSSSGPGVPVATLWDFHTSGWNAWNLRCNIRKTFCPWLQLFTLEKLWLCVCVFHSVSECVFPPVGEFTFELNYSLLI